MPVIISWICLNRDPSSIYITGNTAVDVLRKTIRSNYTHPYLDWANTSRLIILTGRRWEWNERSFSQLDFNRK